MAQVLLQLGVILIIAHVAGWVARMFGQPRVIGEIIGGLALGGLLRQAWPESHTLLFSSSANDFIAYLGEVGVVLLMFQIGSELDFSTLQDKSERRKVSLVAAGSIALPFVLGIGLGTITVNILSAGSHSTFYVLFMGTALSITAMPVLARILMEYGLEKTPLGVITIGATAVNDVIGWVMLAVITAFSFAHGSPGDGFVRVGFMAGFIAAYFAVCIFIVRPVLRKIVLIARYRGMLQSPGITAIILVVIFMSAAATQAMGIHAAIGGFIAGMLVYDQQDLVREWRRSMGHLVIVFFVPLFFVQTGIRADLGELLQGYGVLWALIITVVATVSKIGGTFVAARIAGIPMMEAKMMGVLMNTRGLMEMVVINIGYSIGVISEVAVACLVLMAVTTTIITAPLMRALVGRYGGSIQAGLQPER